MKKIYLLLMLCMTAVVGCRTVSPLQIAVCDPVQLCSRDADIVGLKLNLPSGRNRNVMGIDTGIFGHVDGAMSGIQANVLLSSANEMNGIQVVYGPVGISRAPILHGLQSSWGVLAASVTGRGHGMQTSLGLPISVNAATNSFTGMQFLPIGLNFVDSQLAGVQISTINIAGSVKGLQIGLCNVSKDSLLGVQFGLLNYCQRLKGVQIGVLNASMDHRYPCLPIINARF